jgi:hypothetical protein
MKRVVPIIDLRNPGESRAANERIVDERLVGQLVIQAIQENGAYLEAARQVRASVATFQAQLAEALRSIASVASSLSISQVAFRRCEAAFRRTLAELPPRAPMVMAAFDAWKALPEGDTEPMDRFLSEHLKLHVTPTSRKLLWNIIDTSLARDIHQVGDHWLVLGKWESELIEELDRSLKLYGEIENALLDYDASKSSRQRKREELPGAAYCAWSTIQRPGHSDTLVNTAANYLKEIGLGLGASKLARDGKLADEPDIAEDDELLRAFECQEEAQQQIALLPMLAEKASFSERQQQVYGFDLGVGTDFDKIDDATKAAALELGITPADVRKHRERYREKLAKACRAS